jgi:hypothetical protein
LCFYDLSARSRPASPGRQIDGAVEPAFMSFNSFKTFM